MWACIRCEHAYAKHRQRQEEGLSFWGSGGGVGFSETGFLCIALAVLELLLLMLVWFLCVCVSRDQT